MRWPWNALSSQLQATVLGLLASVMATLLGWMAEGKMPLHHVVILCSASVSTAFMSSLLQGIKPKTMLFQKVVQAKINKIGVRIHTIENV